MGHLINDLLQLSRTSRSELSCATVDLAEIASDLMVELERNEPDREVELVMSGDLLVRGDPPLLRAVMQNLLDNAWKFTRHEQSARIELRGQQRAGGQLIVVQDNGVGFNMEYVSKLFGAFQRLHSEADFEGTGIGLATVKRIIERHGGEVWAEAEVGKGAKVFFSLPKT
jgi:signal transduction histidine kinase